MNWYVQLSAARNPVALYGPSAFSLESRYSLSSGYWLDRPNIEDYAYYHVSISLVGKLNDPLLQHNSPEPVQRRTPC